MMHRILSSLLLLAIAAGAHATLIALPGTTPQSTPAYTTFPNDLRVQALDASGQPVAGAMLRVGYPAGGISGPASTQGCVIDLGYMCDRVADENGVLTVPAPRALTVGAARMFFFFGNDRLEVALTVTPAVASAAVELLGAGQSIVIGRESQPFGVRVTRNGAPVAGLSFSFYTDTSLANAVPTAPSRFGQVAATTDANGIAMMGTLRAEKGLGPGLVVLLGFDQDSGTYIRDEIAFVQTDAGGSTRFEAQHLWWGGPAQSGWGVSIAQHDTRLFNVVFAYDERGRPTWFHMPDGKWQGGVGNKFVGSFYAPTGSPYYAYDPARLDDRTNAAFGTIAFDDQRRARLTLSFNPYVYPRAALVSDIERFEFAPAVPQPERGVTDIWWGGPAQNGWGLSLTEQEGNLFGAWFTYDADGRATWFELPAGRWIDATTWTGNVYRTAASGWLFDTFDPASVQEVLVGTATLRFADGSHAEFSYSVEGHQGTVQVQRFSY
jgi:hypothetical protein